METQKEGWMKTTFSLIRDRFEIHYYLLTLTKILAFNRQYLKNLEMAQYLMQDSTDLL